jgi:hypothetical protein
MIQAFNKIAWQLECPTSQVNWFYQIYQILKVVKRNNSTFCLLGSGLLLMKNVFSKYFHASFQMLINHVSLRGLVNADKEFETLRLKGQRL